jgi:hypothetical protein
MQAVEFYLQFGPNDRTLPQNDALRGNVLSAFGSMT